MSRTEPLGVGVIGGGYIGTTVGRLFNQDPRSTVAVLAEVDAETLRTAGQTLYVGEERRADRN
jgi:predicted dinucleotide-utilizing enzyme